MDGLSIPAPRQSGYGVERATGRAEKRIQELEQSLLPLRSDGVIDIRHVEAGPRKWSENVRPR